MYKVKQDPHIGCAVNNKSGWNNLLYVGGTEIEKFCSATGMI